MLSAQMVKDFTCKVSQKKPKCTYASQSYIASGLKDQNHQKPAFERVFAFAGFMQHTESITASFAGNKH